MMLKEMKGGENISRGGGGSWNLTPAKTEGIVVW